MVRLLACLCFALVLHADDWVRYRSGPFEILTDAGRRHAERVLLQLEQFRYGLGSVLGTKELQALWPVRIVLFRSAKQYAAYASPLGLGLARDSYTGASSAGDPLPRAVLRSCARILIDSSIGRLPQDIELGLADLFSTLETDGSRITLGLALPPSERNENWAKMHMLAVTPDYYGKLRVLVHNLEQGVAAGPAYRNAFGKSPAEIEGEAKAYLGAAKFPTAPLSGRVIRPEKEFSEENADSVFAEAALADLWLADPRHAAEARAAYESLVPRSPEAAHEGLGLLALAAGQTEEARKQFAAVEGGKSARASFEYGRLEPDPQKARAALEKAAQLNPRWAAPRFELAQRESDPQQKLKLLANAAELERRNSGYWRALAEAYAEQKQFAEAARAWAAAEQAAPNETERARLQEIRAETERKRLEHEAAEKQRLAKEKQRHIQELKKQAMASIEAALEKANRANAPEEPGEKRKVVEWWEGPKAEGRVRGLLQRVDCLGKQLRLVIEGQDHKLVRLLILDPQKVAVAGGKELTFGCGPQRPPRKIAVDYFPKADPKLNTTGEVAVIDFPE